MKARILLVEDEPAIVEILTDLLTAEGHSVESLADGNTALRRIFANNFDLLVLDAMLPGMTGFEICQAARKDGFMGAIIMLTALGQVRDRVEGLRTGADDYLVKPFDPDELIARIDALLRRLHRSDPAAVETMVFGNVTANFSRSTYLKSGIAVNLAIKEARLLRLLVNLGGRVVSRDEILAEIWPDQPFITPRTIDVHIAWLRQKLEDQADAPQHILTIRGEGYRFVK